MENKRFGELLLPRNLRLGHRDTGSVTGGGALGGRSCRSCRRRSRNKSNVSGNTASSSSSEAWVVGR